MPSTGLSTLGLVFAAAAFVTGCAGAPSPADDPAEPAGVDSPAEAWQGASEEEALLYHQAVALGVDRHPDIQKLMVTTLLHEQVYSQLETSAVDEAELRAFFEEHRESFATPARVHIRRILLVASEDLGGTALRDLADSTHRAVVADTGRFASLARQHSQGPYAPLGGDLGFVTAEGKGGVDGTVVDRAFAMAPGAPPELFETSEGWNILWAPARRDRIEPSFDAVRHTVLRRLRAQRHKALQDKYVQGLRGGTEGSP